MAKKVVIVKKDIPVDSIDMRMSKAEIIYLNNERGTWMCHIMYGVV